MGIRGNRNGAAKYPALELFKYQKSYKVLKGKTNVWLLGSGEYMNNFARFIILVSMIGLFSFAGFAQKVNTMTIKVYFTDSTDNANFEDCGKVRAVERTIPKTKAVAKAALNELFKGPTKEETDAGLYSFFSKDSASILKNINVKGGNAYVNFDKWILENLGNATTSCGSASFVSEIETTLKQFRSIKKVFYAIEKDPAAYYEWMQVGECPKELKNCDNSKF